MRKHVLRPEVLSLNPKHVPRPNNNKPTAARCPSCSWPPPRVELKPGHFHFSAPSLVHMFRHDPSWPQPQFRGHRRGTLWSLSLPHPADAGGDGDACEQHRANRHAGDNASHGAVGLEHVVVQPSKDVTDAHEASDDGCAGERDGALLQVADAPNLRELGIDLVNLYGNVCMCMCMSLCMHMCLCMGMCTGGAAYTAAGPCAGRRTRGS